MKLKTYLIALLGFLLLAPTHGKEEPTKAGERYRYAIAGVLEPAQKIRCARAGVHLDIWQQRLKLSDWDIELSCQPFSNMPGAYGVTEWKVEQRRAKIWVNAQTDKKDPEEVVIHELLHLVIGEMKAADSAMIEEQTVWLLGGIIYYGKGAKKCIEQP